MTSITMEEFVQSGNPGWEITEEEFKNLLTEAKDLWIENHEHDVILVARNGKYYILDRTRLRVRVL